MIVPDATDGEDDLRFMKKLGANLIRLQLSHYFFEPIGNPGSYREAAFAQLNAWIEWAKDEQVYLLIDLHVPYGGRQYSGSAPEGDTLWSSEIERGNVISLWREIIRRTKANDHVLYEIMNEPDPLGAGVSTDQWWELAQDIVDAIRAAGSDHLLVIPCPLADQPFELVQDTQNNLAYDFHFYKPSEFTHQQAHWMIPPYPKADYPYDNGIECQRQ